MIINITLNIFKSEMSLAVVYSVGYLYYRKESWYLVKIFVLTLSVDSHMKRNSSQSILGIYLCRRAEKYTHA